MQAVQCTRERHGDAILDIFNDAILHSTALYDYKPRTAQNMADWFAAKARGNFPVLGLENEDGSLAGFGSYGTFRAWPAYKYTVEHSVYVHPSQRGRGIGLALMQQLIAAAREQQYHVLIGGIDMENQASIALHTRLGFVHAGTIRQAGFKFGRWLDLGFYQLTLDTPLQPVDG
ncbi:GNAT family N-acetyltransferase|uniref:GNAT family N-acetyltransferase n=1 Tax=Noviherbaspirillum sp. L7-7A TaxID=2850560 RepID=UPI001C2BA95D|nr:GNAT family N-acetyltransferase [Noviherbaspirillum sp. L7-7A]MBV0880088.1 GNAT family N-acetyltransferase [Noviherbaspirillum sp. L7-7A]